MRCDSADVKQLLARWDYDPDAVDTYGRAMEAAMGHQQARAVLEGTVQAYQAGEPVDIYLRVKRALPRANLVVRRGEQEIARFPRQFVAPGEMQRITLSCPELANGADGEELTVSLEEALDVG